MVKMGDGRSPYKSRGARKKNRKRPFRPDGVCLSLNLFKRFISSAAPFFRMVKMGDGRAPYRSRGTREKNSERSFRPDIKEEPWNVSEAGRNVLKKQIASRAVPAKSYTRSTIGIGQALRQDSEFINNNATGPLKTPMASQQHPTTMDNLPDEILLNIFIRLLAKQLAQMRSVSKSWNALLSQPSFVNSHLARSIHNNDQILLVFNLKVCSCDSKPFTAHPSRSPHLELTDFNKPPPVNPESGHAIPSPSPSEINLPTLFSPPVDSIMVIGSVNGLICSSYGTSVIQIWNPSLSAVLTLPTYHVISHSPFELNFRFGFDPKTNDYKVVKLTGLPIMVQPSEYGFFHFPYYTMKEWLPVEVYSMRKGSWELITARIPSNITRIFEGDTVCLDGRDGHLHWLGCYSSGKTYLKTIVAFDLGSETFSEISFPDSVLDHHPCFTVIGVLAGKLCTMSRGENDNAYELWVMEEYGVAESWVKHHVFSQFTPYSSPIGFTSHNEFLIKNYGDDRRLVLYDPVADKTKSFQNFCCRESHPPQKIVEYVDSLVWVAPAEPEVVDGGAH